MYYAMRRPSSLGETYPIGFTIPQQSPIMAGQYIGTDVSVPVTKVVNDIVDNALKRFEERWPPVERRLLSTIDQAVDKVENRLGGAVDSRANQAAKIAKIAVIATVGVAGIAFLLRRKARSAERVPARA